MSSPIFCLLCVFIVVFCSGGHYADAREFSVLTQKQDRTMGRKACAKEGKQLATIRNEKKVEF